MRVLYAAVHAKDVDAISKLLVSDNERQKNSITPRIV